LETPSHRKDGLENPSYDAQQREFGGDLDIFLMPQASILTPFLRHSG